MAECSESESEVFFVSDTADPTHLARAIELAKSSEGLTAPHPNAGCVLVHGSEVVGEGFLYAQGTESAEAQAVRAAGPRAAGATAYMNLEPGDCHGDRRAVKALIDVRASFFHSLPFFRLII